MLCIHVCTCVYMCLHVCTCVSLILAARPIYNPPKIQVAYVSEPFVFDFNYTAPFSPFFYSWCKNGNSFQGDGARITIDHTGIVFTNVKPEDAGQYSIKAGVQGEVVTIYSYLNGKGGGVRHIMAPG